MNNGRIPMEVPLIGQPKPQQPTHLSNPGPLAHPVSFPALVQHSSGQAGVLTFGGLTKLEYAAV